MPTACAQYRNQINAFRSQFAELATQKSLLCAGISAI
jgi:hypothetical protein